MTNCIFQRWLWLSLTPHALPQCDFSTSSIKESEPWIWAGQRLHQPIEYERNDAVWLLRLGHKKLCSNPCYQKHTWSPESFYNKSSYPEIIMLERSHYSPPTNSPAELPSYSVNCQTCEWASWDFWPTLVLKWLQLQPSLNCKHLRASKLALPGQAPPKSLTCKIMNKKEWLF